mmetsp:Transcript_29142/g.82726  ORF Transcript_29142/g.82726 Transcript_29142/m.82726 type:complete len:395 (-) Transcript_29142:479-1663(-)
MTCSTRRSSVSSQLSARKTVSWLNFLSNASLTSTSCRKADNFTSRAPSSATSSTTCASRRASSPCKRSRGASSCALAALLMASNSARSGRPPLASPESPVPATRGQSSSAPNVVKVVPRDVGEPSLTEQIDARDAAADASRTPRTSAAAEARAPAVAAMAPVQAARELEDTVAAMWAPAPRGTGRFILGCRGPTATPLQLGLCPPAASAPPLHVLPPRRKIGGHRIESPKLALPAFCNASCSRTVDSSKLRSSSSEYRRRISSSRDKLSVRCLSSCNLHCRPRASTACRRARHRSEMMSELPFCTWSPRGSLARAACGVYRDGRLEAPPSPSKPACSSDRSCATSAASSDHNASRAAKANGRQASSAARSRDDVRETSSSSLPVKLMFKSCLRV